MAENVIYYFSGTGNSLAVAKQVAKKLGDTKLLSILALEQDGRVPSGYGKVGFIFPTCFSRAPRIVMDIGRKAVFAPGQRVFIVVTCGGHDGHALIDFSRLLQPKTRAPVQCFRLPMPPNHIVGFSPVPVFGQRMYLRHAEKATAKIARRVREGRPTRPKWELNRKMVRAASIRFNGWLGVPDVDSQEAEYYTTGACTRCGACAKICKAGNIRVSAERVEFGNNCQQCMGCVQWCPRRAIAHPNIPAKRKRYHHPGIRLEDMMRTPGVD